ncbi:TPA: methyltransferase, partial [Candidatus Micrarchaeota archaeon]|nr:methyltransferase [Candidatus Micrarchaeota archaeon]
GEPRTSTIHVEYGVKMFVDLSLAYFNPRLAYEHRRVAEQVSDGEIVLDMFAGVGGFTLHIVTLREALVVANDLNRRALLCLLRGLELNRGSLKGEVIVLEADALRLSAALRANAFDRVIMDNPTNCLEFLPVACRLLRPRGTLHLYAVAGENEVPEMVEGITKVINSAGRKVASVNVRKVIDYSPRTNIYCFDLNVH